MLSKWYAYAHLSLGGGVCVPSSRVSPQWNRNGDGFGRAAWSAGVPRKPPEEIMNEGKDIPEPLLESLEKAILTIAESGSRSHKQRQNQEPAQEIHEQARIIKNTKDEAKKVTTQAGKVIKESIVRQQKVEAYNDKFFV